MRLRINFCPSSDYSDDKLHNGFDEDQIEAIAKLLQDLMSQQMKDLL